ncbi:MAG TPA: hypothetical protein VF942_12000 [Acidimicrobiales bacterium]
MWDQRYGGRDERNRDSSSWAAQNFTSQKLRVELTTALSELALASGGVVSVLEENGIKGDGV